MKQEKSALTEAELVETVRRGRREGQTELVGRYAERVFAMIVRQVTDPMDAQELTQDTFMHAFSHIGSYDAQRSSLSTWLCCIAYRLTLDFLRRRRPHVVHMDDSTESQATIDEEQLEAVFSTNRNDHIERLGQLVDELADDEQMLLTLYYFDDLPLSEIATITGVEPAPLAKRLYRIRRKLYQKFKDSDNGTKI